MGSKPSAEEILDKNRKDLTKAIREGDIEAAKAAIDELTAIQPPEGIPSYLNFSSGYGTPLQLAIHFQQPEIFDLILEKGASVNSVDPLRNGPLYTCIDLNAYQYAKKLLTKGADPKIYPKYDLPLFLRAIEAGTEDIAIEFLNYGADPNQIDADKMSALFLASSKGLTKLVKKLIEQGATIDTAEALDAETPLMRAARKGHFDIVKLLVGAGADPLRHDKDGRTAKWHAAEEAHQEIVDFLDKAGDHSEVFNMAPDRVDPTNKDPISKISDDSTTALISSSSNDAVAVS